MGFIDPDELHILAIMVNRTIYRSDVIPGERFAQLTVKGLPPSMFAYHQFSGDWQKVLAFPIHPRRHLITELKLWATTNRTPPLETLKECSPRELLDWLNRIVQQDYRKLRRERKRKLEEKFLWCLTSLMKCCLEEGLTLIRWNGKGDYYFWYGDSLSEDHPKEARLIEE